MNTCFYYCYEFILKLQKLYCPLCATKIHTNFRWISRRSFVIVQIFWPLTFPSTFFLFKKQSPRDCHIPKNLKCFPLREWRVRISGWSTPRLPQFWSQIVITKQAGNGYHFFFSSLWWDPVGNQTYNLPVSKWTLSLDHWGGLAVHAEEPSAQTTDLFTFCPLWVSSYKNRAPLSW